MFKQLAVTALVLTAASIGCDKKKQAQETSKAAKTVTAPSAAAAKPEKQPIDGKATNLAFSELSVDMTVPAAWKHTSLGSTTQIWRRPGDLISSTVTVSEGCGGYSCAALADNVANALAMQLKIHKEADVKVKVLDKQAAPGAGAEFLLRLEAYGSVSMQYTRLFYRKGWKRLINCTSIAVDKDVANISALKAMCVSAKVTLKKA